MSLTAALDALIAPTPKQCAVGAWFDALDENSREKLDHVLESGISRSKVHGVLAANGFSWSPSALNNHLSGRCACTVTKELAA